MSSYGLGVRTPPTIVVDTNAAAIDACSKNIPNMEILFTPGTYANLVLNVNTPGVKLKPITPGTVTFSGNSKIYLNAPWQSVSGIFFDTITPAPSVSMRSNFCYCSNNKFNKCGDAASSTSAVVQMREGASYNYVRNNLFSGTKSSTIVMSLAENLPVGYGNVIERNIFEDTLYTGLNGFEAVQIGQTTWANDLNTGVRISENVFNGTDAEDEVISFKSSSNVLNKNIFVNMASGVASVRRGYNNKVLNNYFANMALALKIFGSGHIVSGNSFINNTYGIALLDGDTNHVAPNSSIISNNTFDLNGTNFRVTGSSSRAALELQPFGNIITNNMFDGAIWSDRYSTSYNGDTTDTAFSEISLNSFGNPSGTIPTNVITSGLAYIGLPLWAIGPNW